MEEDTKQNPWLGLESYQEGEVLYGRDEDIRDLIQCVLNDVDTLLYGKSGIGKSSILNAGILPAARRNGYLPVLIRFSHKEDEDYLQQIKSAIICAMGISIEDNDEISRRIKEVVRCKDPNKESLYEFLHRHTFHDKDGNRIKLLIIFDQFEEIFTLQPNESKKRRFFAQMADVLNDIMPNDLQVFSNGSTPQELIQVDSDNVDDLFDDLDLGEKSDLPEYVTDNDIHFVFTIREDFLSEFEYYTASIPSLKQNRYGLRPINDEQASQIILRPQPGLISLPVAKLIIEKVTGRSDFELNGIPEIEVDSAVLSLYLNRLYDAKNSSEITSELVEQKGGEIIADFYNEAISNISQSSVEYLEDMLINGQGRRDNITVYDALHDGGLTKEELNVLCVQKKILRQFNYAGVLRIEYIHDILCPIIVQRKEKRAEETRVKQIEAIAREEKAKSRKRLFWAIAALFFLATGIAGYFLYNWYYYEYPVKTYYVAYELRNGWPVGIGSELSESEKDVTPIYYELSHPGHAKNRYNSIRVCSSNNIIDSKEIIIPMLLGEIIPEDSISRTISELKSKIRLITFAPTAESNSQTRGLDYMAFFDVDGNLLFTIKQAQEEDQGKWFTFYNAKGQLMPINEYNIDRINVKQNPEGYVTSALYYDNNGVKRPLYNNIYGYTQTIALSDSSYYNVINELTITTINQFSQPSSNKDNTTKFVFGKDFIAVSVYNLSDGNLVEVNNATGFSKSMHYKNNIDYYKTGSDSPFASVEIIRDENGNVTQEKLMDSELESISLPAMINRTFDSNGRLTSMELLDKNGKPFSPNHNIYKYSYGYSDHGGLCLHEERSDTGLVYYYKKEILSNNVEAVSLGGRQFISDNKIPFHLKIDSILSNSEAVSYYYSLDGEPINFDDGDNLPYHKIVSIKNDSIEDFKYFKLVSENDIEPLNGEGSYHRLLRKFDVNGNMKTEQKFDSNGNILKSMMYFYNNGRIVGRAAMGIDGTPVRCDEWEEEGFLYYKLLFNCDYKKNYCDFLAINEFDKPSAFQWNGVYLRFNYKNFINSTLVIKDALITTDLRTDTITGTTSDALATSITLTKDYWTYYIQADDALSQTEVVYVHCLTNDAPMYLIGIKDGDICLSCGSWEMGRSLVHLFYELKNSKELVVLRTNGESYQKISIPLRQINNDVLSKFHFHSMKLKMSELNTLIN